MAGVDMAVIVMAYAVVAVIVMAARDADEGLMEAGAHAGAICYIQTMMLYIHHDTIYGSRRARRCTRTSAHARVTISQSRRAGGRAARRAGGQGGHTHTHTDTPA